MIVSVFFIRVSFSVRLGRVCARYGDDVSTLRERDDGAGGDDGRWWSGERDRGVRGGGLSDGNLPYRLAYLYDVASLREIEVITLVHTVYLEYPDLHPSHIIHT